MAADNLVLVVQRKLKGSPERLFDAWTRPELMKQWFHAGDKMTTPVAEADLKPGGPWRIGMRAQDGQEHFNSGKYLVIERPHKLVFTWHPKGDPDFETKVTLLFKKVSEEFTEMTLTHEGLRDQYWYDRHNGGWMGCLDTLERWLAE